MEFNQKGRLFVFGCSITKYKYPTWADIIGTTWAHYENRGNRGGGNESIFNSIIKCISESKLTSNDTVLIMWSGIARIDWNSNTQWNTAHRKIPFFGSELIPDMNGYKIKSFAYFQAINDILTNRNIPFSMMSWQQNIPIGVGEIYKSVLSNIRYVEILKKRITYPDPRHKKNVYERLYKPMHGVDWPSVEQLYTNNYVVDDTIQLELDDFVRQTVEHGYTDTEYYDDWHPAPLEHLDIVKQHFPSIKIPNEIHDSMHDIESGLMRGTYESYYLPALK